MENTKVGTLRVYMIRNVPNEPTCKYVKTSDEAKQIIRKAIKKDLQDDSISDNVFGLEEFIELDGKLQWSEWYSDETGNDIMQEIEEEDEQE